MPQSVGKVSTTSGTVSALLDAGLSSSDACLLRVISLCGTPLQEGNMLRNGLHHTSDVFRVVICMARVALPQVLLRWQTLQSHRGHVAAVRACPCQDSLKQIQAQLLQVTASDGPRKTQHRLKPEEGSWLPVVDLSGVGSKEPKSVTFRSRVNAGVTGRNTQGHFLFLQALQENQQAGDPRAAAWRFLVLFFIMRKVLPQ